VDDHAPSAAPASLAGAPGRDGPQGTGSNRVRAATRHRPARRSRRQAPTNRPRRGQRCRFPPRRSRTASTTAAHPSAVVISRRDEMIGAGSIAGRRASGREDSRTRLTQPEPPTGLTNAFRSAVTSVRRPSSSSGRPSANLERHDLAPSSPKMCWSCTGLFGSCRRPFQSPRSCHRDRRRRSGSTVW